MEKPALPNYQRIKQELLQEIGLGNFRPDELFITQQEVCQRFQVSRITAERALNELVRDGILVRRRGLGTFVAESPPALISGASAVMLTASVSEERLNFSVRSASSLRRKTIGPCSNLANPGASAEIWYAPTGS